MTAQSVDGPISLAERLRGASVVIDRLDRDTLSVARWVASLGAEVTIADRRGPTDGPVPGSTPGVSVTWETDLNRTPLVADVLLVHDYTSPLEPFVLRARGSHTIVAHWADLLLEVADATTVGVTGSAGKSTTARLVAEMLTASGERVFIPRQHELVESANPNWELVDAIQQLRPGTFMVLELTSSHLEYMSRSPQIAVITTLTPDHIEWHGSLERYLDAKDGILRGQGADDWAVLNRDEPEHAKRLRATARGRVAAFGNGAPTVSDGAFVIEDEIVLVRDGRPEGLVALNEVLLPRPYVGNFLAAATAASIAGAEVGAIRSVARTFKGLSSRMRLVARANGVSVFDDGVALTPRKASASVGAFPSGTVVLICGGDDLVEGWSMAPMHSSDDEQPLLAGFADLVAARVKHVVILGAAGERLEAAFLRAGVRREILTQVSSLEDAVERALDAAGPGDNVLFAPVFDPGVEDLARFAHLAERAMRGPSRACVDE